ncbi:MAG: hypothetical protein WBQ27_18745 [Thermoanaerobaculia bacterium]
MASVSYESRWATKPEVEIGHDSWSRTPLSRAVSVPGRTEANLPAYLNSNPDAEKSRGGAGARAAVPTFAARARRWFAAAPPGRRLKTDLFEEAISIHHPMAEFPEGGMGMDVSISVVARASRPNRQRPIIPSGKVPLRPTMSL